MNLPEERKPRGLEALFVHDMKKDNPPPAAPPEEEQPVTPPETPTTIPNYNEINFDKAYTALKTQVDNIRAAVVSGKIKKALELYLKLEGDRGLCKDLLEKAADLIESTGKGLNSPYHLVSEGHGRNTRNVIYPLDGK